MPRINEHYLNLNASYLFAEIKRRTEAFRRAHPEANVISLGIGDVTQPLPPAVVGALEAAAREQADARTLKGYGPYVGYEWLTAGLHKLEDPKWMSDGTALLGYWTNAVKIPAPPARAAITFDWFRVNADGYGSSNEQDGSPA